MTNELRNAHLQHHTRSTSALILARGWVRIEFPITTENRKRRHHAQETFLLARQRIHRIIRRG